MVWKLILNFLTGGIGKAVEGWRDYKIAELKARGERNTVIQTMELERLEAERAIALKALETAAEIRLATKEHWEMRLAVGMAAISTSLYYTLVFLDSIFYFSWNVARLPGDMHQWAGYILLSFFGLSGAKFGFSALARKIK